mgnify:CR=1 FL=1
MCHGDGVKEEGGLQNIREPQASFADYDGDGNVEEGMYFEIQGLQEQLLAAIQAYATDTAGAEIKYDATTYPYFMGADGKAGDPPRRAVGDRLRHRRIGCVAQGTATLANAASQSWATSASRRSS